MPEYRSIQIELHSQFDADMIAEFDPLPQEYYTSRGIKGTVPRTIDEASSTCSVYVPALPSSVFWISYSIFQPIPDEYYFLFKLYINGTHIVSWSTGKDEEWKGKTMFGLYEGPEDEEGKRRVEKRVLSFMSPEQNAMEWDNVKDAFEDNMRMEIKVHRAHSRVRAERKVEEYSKTQYAQEARGIDLVSAGRANSKQPKRFYKFALIDAVDQPFVTFRYYYRTWAQLQALGLAKHVDNEETAESSQPSAGTLDQPHAYIPRGAPGAHLITSRKSDSQSSIAYRPHPASPVEQWKERSPSPLVKSIREGLSSLTLGKGKEEKGKEGSRAASLIKAISSTWRRGA